ncbi:Tar ligand binding domain-containing protein [Cupriavidus basilensis]
MNRSTSLNARLSLSIVFLGLLCILIAATGIIGMHNANKRAKHTYESLTQPGQAFEASYIMTMVAGIQLMEGLVLDDDSTGQQRGCHQAVARRCSNAVRRIQKQPKR